MYLSREWFIERISMLREEELELARAQAMSVLEQLGTPDAARREWPELYDYVACGIDLDFLTMQMKGEEIRDKTVKSWDPMSGGYSQEGKLYQDWLGWYVDSFTDVIMQQGDSLFFCGYNSSGKSFTGSLIASCAMDKGHTAYIMKSSHLYQAYNERYSAPEAQSLFDLVVNVDFLVLDELGKELGDPVKIKRVLEEVVKHRVGMNLPTLIITNLQIEDASEDDRRKGYPASVKQTYGVSFWEQLLGRYHFFVFSKNGDFRRQNRRAWGRKI